MKVSPDEAKAEPPCVWREWAALIEACSEYAALSGWRFVGHDFLNLDSPASSAVRAAKTRALPTALEYADRVRSCAAAAIVAAAAGEPPPELVSEFQACQRLVASEAVYNSMVATLAAVGLSPRRGQDEEAKEGDGAASPAAASDAGAKGGAGAAAVPDEEAMAYHDMTQPIEVAPRPHTQCTARTVHPPSAHCRVRASCAPQVVARRLSAHVSLMEATPVLRDERQRRLLQASFIVANPNT